MADAHRTNVLVTSFLKTPVDPLTKAPLASFERGRILPYSGTGQSDNPNYEEMENEDSGSDFCDKNYLGKAGPHLGNGYGAAGECLNLSEIFFSNKEYFSKLDELKQAHRRTMAELEGMYQQKLQLKSSEPFGTTRLDRFLWTNMSPAASHRCLRKSHSAVELRWGSGPSDSMDENESGNNDVGLFFFPKEYIKNMWKDFKVSPHNHHLSSLSLHSLPPDQIQQKRNGKKKLEYKDRQQENSKHRVTIAKPFHMTLREAERRKQGLKTSSEVDVGNTELRRQLEELTECQRTFHASPVPAHVHLPLYEKLQEQNEERRRTMREREQQLRTSQKPFNFLERERLKKEQKQQQQPPDQEKVKPFKAKPVPKSVYAAASGEQRKEEQMYRSIKIQMRAEEMLHSASVPPSMLTRRLSERKKTKKEAEGDDRFSHRPQINKEVPDFNASYKRFQKQLEKRKEVKPTTACEPFELRTSQISSHQERILADIEKDRSSPWMLRWPHVSPGPAHTPNSSLCSSLSGSMEVLPAKVTDATKKRHEAVRKVLEQRKKAEEEEERWKEKQKQREKKLQTVVLKRAQANDPHLALSQTQNNKLKEFRKQDFQRMKEYQQEIQDMQARVMGRPLLLEQVAQRNSKQAAEKRYIEVLRRCDVTEDFVSRKAASSATNRKTSSSNVNQSDLEEAEYEPVLYRKVFLDDEDIIGSAEREGGREKKGDEFSLNQECEEDAGGHHTEDNYHGGDPHYFDESYTDDHENYSDDSKHEADTRQQEAGK